MTAQQPIRKTPTNFRRPGTQQAVRSSGHTETTCFTADGRTPALQLPRVSQPRKAVQIQCGVAHGVLDLLEAMLVRDQAQVAPLVGKLLATTVAQQVRVRVNRRDRTLGAWTPQRARARFGLALSIAPRRTRMDPCRARLAPQPFESGPPHRASAEGRSRPNPWCGSSRSSRGRGRRRSSAAVQARWLPARDGRPSGSSRGCARGDGCSCGAQQRRDFVAGQVGAKALCGSHKSTLPEKPASRDRFANSIVFNGWRR